MSCDRFYAAKYHRIVLPKCSIKYTVVGETPFRKMTIISGKRISFILMLEMAIFTTGEIDVEIFSSKFFLGYFRVNAALNLCGTEINFTNGLTRRNLRHGRKDGAINTSSVIEETSNLFLENLNRCRDERS